jgi:hypothetical protein
MKVIIGAKIYNFEYPYLTRIFAKPFISAAFVIPETKKITPRITEKKMVLNLFFWEIISKIF